jgi:hypothetical protein
MALILEIEELLFDTRSVRAMALCDALRQEGVSIDAVQVAMAHAGVPAAVAMQRLAPLLDLDATGRELVLLRAMEGASRSFSAQAPSFNAELRDVLVMLRGEFALGVVTRATGAEALQWLEAAGLEASIATVRSLAALDPSEYVASWADALRRTLSTRGAAIAAPAMLRVARQAGLWSIQLGPDPDPAVDGYHPDVQLETLSQVQAALLATHLR